MAEVLGRADDHGVGVRLLGDPGGSANESRRTERNSPATPVLVRLNISCFRSPASRQASPSDSSSPGREGEPREPGAGPGDQAVVLARIAPSPAPRLGARHHADLGQGHVARRRLSRGG